MKMFFKCTLSALAVSALVVLALLSSGCNKGKGNSPSSDLIGKWYLEFYEEDFGGECMIGYIFNENGELTVNISCSDEQGSMSLLWYADGNKLYTLDMEEKEIYDESGIEWPYVEFKVSGNTLDFYGEDGETVTFARIK